jgi:hypothetical protein
VWGLMFFVLLVLIVRAVATLVQSLRSRAT